MTSSSVQNRKVKRVVALSTGVVFLLRCPTTSPLSRVRPTVATQAVAKRTSSAKSHPRTYLSGSPNNALSRCSDSRRLSSVNIKVFTLPTGSVM